MEQMIERLLAKMNANMDAWLDEMKEDSLPRNDGGLSGE
jgi:hypothetical protein